MKRVIVRYKVKKDKAQLNVEYIQNVFSAIKNSKPNGFRYASFLLDDGVSFVHIASIETNDESNPLESLKEFKDFAKDISSRCEEQPVVAIIAETIGNYGVF